MVKFNELRIGNCFKYSNNGIIKIDKDILVSILTTNGLLNSEKIQPIHLSGHLLEKIGSVRQTRGKETYRISIGENFHIEIIFGGFFVEDILIYRYYPEIEGSETGVISVAPFKYLHELQNLHFAISGVELEVINILNGI